MIEESQVSKFYASKKILITGGTGFMGKVLIWKLLHSCPNVNTIYVLMRSKYGKNLSSRKKELFDAPIFDTFRKNNPEILEKVIIISGDVGEDGIGLSDKDRNAFIEEVSIIFHSAAILKMNSDLRTAVNVNTVGTARMLDMAQKMHKLEAFVYISTAYSSCENEIVEEKLYPSKHNPYDIIKLVQRMEPEVLEKITPGLIHPLPNTYLYSKRLAEALLHNYVSKVPIIVARPSIVASSFKEPLPGWTDNLNGPSGFYAAGAKGIMRTTMMNLDAKTNVIPVDLTINSILLLPWANRREQLLKQINVYNISQNSFENLTWREVLNCLIRSSHKYPVQLMLWYQNLDPSTNSIFVYTFKCILLHYLPAYLIDFILILVGQKPFLVRVHDKLRQGEQVLMYFTQTNWSFVHDKLLELEKLLNETDKQLFIINMSEMGDIQDYSDDCTKGGKIYIFKEGVDTKSLNTARRITNTMFVIDKITLMLRYYLLWKILVLAFNMLFSLYLSY